MPINPGFAGWMHQPSSGGSSKSGYRGSFTQEFSDAVHESIVMQMRQKSERIVAKAERLAPKDTGYLSRSIGYAIDEANYTVAFFVLAEYGIFQEYGTRNIPPHPYLRPAINEELDIYGFDTSMNFQNVPRIHAPIIAHGKGFHLPSTLTPKQRKHVREHLLPVSKKHWTGNVSRAKLKVRHSF